MCSRWKNVWHLCFLTVTLHPCSPPRGGLRWGMKRGSDNVTILTKRSGQKRTEKKRSYQVISVPFETRVEAPPLPVNQMSLTVKRFPKGEVTVLLVVVFTSGVSEINSTTLPPNLHLPDCCQGPDHSSSRHLPLLRMTERWYGVLPVEWRSCPEQRSVEITYTLTCLLSTCKVESARGTWEVGPFSIGQDYLREKSPKTRERPNKHHYRDCEWLREFTPWTQ